jgi:thioester reductase-like protein
VKDGALEVAIVELAVRIARAPGAGPSTPFALMGLDSLGTIELAAALEAMLGIEVPPDIVADCRNARMLAARVSAIRPDRPDIPIDLDPFDQMFADALLPPDIRPASARRRVTSSFTQAQSILLTGATGYLGRSLARELLEQTGARLLCLIRPRPQPARARLREDLIRAGVDASTFDNRIAVIEGDLAHARLGLERSIFHAVGSRVDAICHAGAMVNWVLPYRSLRAANVLGTRELLTLACLQGIPFHFVSSLAVCYSTHAPESVDGESDALPYLRGVHLGYAQTKVVAEALVREAGRRGLPVSIYRPSLISGHSVTGEFNSDDLLTRLVAGCVEMGTAPDLDWMLDSQPVDVVARHIVRLSGRGGVFHLAHAQPRHWREVVLWMRLYGYPIRLVPYHAWLRELDRVTSSDHASGHPLSPLRTFFLERPPEAGGWTRPELYEVSRRPRVTVRGAGSCTNARPDPALDAALLERYVEAYVASGVLEPPARRAGPKPPTRELDAEFFSNALGKDVRSVEFLRRLSDHSIVSELTSWRSGTQTGLFAYRISGSGLVFQHSSRRPECRNTRPDPDAIDVVVKVKPVDREAIAVGEALARICDDGVGDAYARWADRLGLVQSHVRELAIYSQREPAFVTHLPASLGAMADEATGVWTLVLEHVGNAISMGSIGRPQGWTNVHIDCAVRGLAALHAVWFQREQELRRKPWIGYVSSSADVAEMSDLWTAIARHTSARFSAWADPAIAAIQRRLVAQVERWWQRLDESPRTLIHNDFNPRNICLRRGSALPDDEGLRLCAYDWELATVGVPQRDLAELLCFVLPTEADDEDVEFWIERHRRLLERDTGIAIDPSGWAEGFRAANFELMLSRLPMYALIHRIRRQPFLPRVVRTWRRLYERFPLI